VWIGPSPSAMRALGDKAAAKALAEAAGVPTLPGYHAADQSDAALARAAEQLGFPLLIKASAGGGGRGMRAVGRPSELAETLQAARREAQASFGDARVLLERQLMHPRHIEVQIMADEHGHAVYLGERDCSVQRRHQKLIEESPSPAVDARLREALGQAALRLAHAAGYTNAGTVEFLLDEDGTFAFLEVNARLQVEHPVTEMLTGLDLVELQIRVASGERLGVEQSDVHLRGHAIEARVIAEDPLAGWIPSSGSVVFRPAAGVRIDTWLDTHAPTLIPTAYDSLLAKVIAHGKTRQESLAALASALAHMRLEGVAHNLDLLLDVVQHPVFVVGEARTDFIEAQHVLEDLARVPPAVLAAACAFDVLAPAQTGDPWRTGSAWRIGGVDQPLAWMRAGQRHGALVTRAVDGVSVAINDTLVPVRARGPQHVEINAETVTIDDLDADARLVTWRGTTYCLERPAPLAVEHARGAARGAAAAGQVLAPMPGRVVKLFVAPGQSVEQNQALLVLEAMKMEHVVEAPHHGSVVDLAVTEGEQVQAGALLVALGVG
jgi:3-methylcrotonyl-CoA carboxylase alpha subunit